MKHKHLDVLSRRGFLAAATAVGVAQLGRAVRASAVPTGIVRGMVAGDGKPLPGVLVSDGCRVVRTDPAGRYELPAGPDSGRFVFVTTPRHWWTEKFYLPLAEALAKGRADFSLRRLEQPDDFDLVFICDMHVDNRPWGIPKLRASLREIQQLRPRPAFLWAQGDICLEGGVGMEYCECLAEVRIPVRNGPGNHEMILKRANPREEFERLFGPTYYSFDWGTVHCVVLDGNKPIPGLQGWKAVHGAIEGSELAWLQADLEAQPEGKPIVVGVHIPIVSSYPRRRRKSPPNAPYWEIANRENLTELFAKHRVKLVLQGHMHENERTTVKGVEYVSSIALSGSWYSSGAGMERGVDGSPRGYRIVSVRGNKVTHRYRSSCESRVDRQGELVGTRRFRPGRETALVFNCYDAPNGSTAQARLDNGPWQPMPQFAAVNPAQGDGLVMPHHFRLLADTTGLAPGEHTIEVRVVWPDGTVVNERQSFELLAGP